MKKKIFMVDSISTAVHNSLPPNLATSITGTMKEVIADQWEDILEDLQVTPVEEVAADLGHRLFARLPEQITQKTKEMILEQLIELLQQSQDQ
jgi:hypothetical protein